MVHVEYLRSHHQRLRHNMLLLTNEDVAGNDGQFETAWPSSFSTRQRLILLSTPVKLINFAARSIGCVAEDMPTPRRKCECFVGVLRNEIPLRNGA